MPQRRDAMTGSAADRVRPLLRTRQVRDYTDEPISDEDLVALGEVARWTGSSRNEQPWRFLVLTDRDLLRRLAQIGTPQTLPFRTATAGIAIVLPGEPEREVQDAYDDGRAAERLLVAATMLDLAAAVTWVRRDVREAVGEALGLPTGWFVRTLMAFGHPSEAGRRPKSAPGQARKPREQIVFDERWPR
jgi:nitroreductase